MQVVRQIHINKSNGRVSQEHVIILKQTIVILNTQMELIISIT